MQHQFAYIQYVAVNCIKYSISNDKYEKISYTDNRKIGSDGMNLPDLFAGAIVIAVLVIAVFSTRASKKKGCGPCVGDCSTCSAFSNFYEDYKKDQVHEVKDEKGDR